MANADFVTFVKNIDRFIIHVHIFLVKLWFCHILESSNIRISSLHGTINRKKLEDTKGVTRSFKSKTDNTKSKRTNKYLQNATQKTKDRTTQSPLKIGGEFRCLEGLAVPVSLVTVNSLLNSFRKRSHFFAMLCQLHHRKLLHYKMGSYIYSFFYLTYLPLTLHTGCSMVGILRL